MDFRELVEKTRSFRRFDQSKKISEDELIRLVELARITPSAANQQPLKYRLVTDDEEASQVFRTLRWAAALKDWDGPEEGERPAAYIVILQDMEISNRIWLDSGIAAVTVMFGAVEMGYGGCIIASVDKQQLASVLHIGDRYAVQMVLALGVPSEEVVMESVDSATGSVSYFRSEDGVHHVPKRALKDIIIK